MAEGTLFLWSVLAWGALLLLRFLGRGGDRICEKDLDRE